MKKALILANFDVGLYKFRKELIQELLNQQYKVYISLPDGELVRPLEKMGCIFIDTPVDRRGMNPATDGKLLLFYRKLLKKIKPDMVITYTIKPNIYGGLACRLTGTNYVCNITGLGTAFQKDGFLKKMVVFLYKRALKKAKTVFFENQTNRNIFLENRIVNKTKTIVLSGAGVNLEEYPFTPYPSEESGLHFLFIGRVMKEKGINELFAAAEKCRKNKKIYFDIVGPCEEDYKEKLQDLEQKGILKWYGYQEDVKPFIEKAHCFVLPSWHEGMANTLLESAAMGRPLITSDIPGCREAVAQESKKDKNLIGNEVKTKASAKADSDSNGEVQFRNGDRGANGMLCQPKDSESLLRAIEKFCQLTEEERQEMGRRSREWMEQRFDKRKVVEETMRGIGL